MEHDEFRQLHAAAGEAGRDPEEGRWTKTSGHTDDSRPDCPNRSKRAVGTVAGGNLSPGFLWISTTQVSSNWLSKAAGDGG